MPSRLKTSEVLIAVGSNLGQRHELVGKAVAEITAHCGGVSAIAPLYETDPLGSANQTFLNTALICRTDLTPHEMLDTLQLIEHRLGRERHRRWGNRTIDLDIILWRDSNGKFLRLETPDLVIPHPEYLKRDFVLVPAAAIAGHWILPETKHSLEWECIARGFHLLPVGLAEIQEPSSFV
jgi:2-amino-4-hydroxy-6-hydroxymethyldihydropteridine diphosphokinase